MGQCIRSQLSAVRYWYVAHAAQHATPCMHAVCKAPCTSGCCFKLHSLVHQDTNAISCVRPCLPALNTTIWNWQIPTTIGQPTSCACCSSIDPPHAATQCTHHRCWAGTRAASGSGTRRSASRALTSQCRAACTKQVRCQHIHDCKRLHEPARCHSVAAALHSSSQLGRSPCRQPDTPPVPVRGCMNGCTIRIRYMMRACRRCAHRRLP